MGAAIHRTVLRALPSTGRVPRPYIATIAIVLFVAFVAVLGYQAVRRPDAPIPAAPPIVVGPASDVIIVAKAGAQIGSSATRSITATGDITQATGGEVPAPTAASRALELPRTNVASDALSITQQLQTPQTVTCTPSVGTAFDGLVHTVSGLLHAVLPIAPDASAQGSC